MKYKTEWTPNDNGEIVKVEYIDGVVIDEAESTSDESGGDTGGFCFFFWRFGGARSEPKRKPYNDNGREYNPASGNWEYTADANGNVNPFHCDYEAPQDGQGSVPVWDGYNG